MKIEVLKDGTVVCDSSTCVKWVETETTCLNCPMDKLFARVMEYHAENAQWKLKLDYEVHNDNRY